MKKLTFLLDVDGVMNTGQFLYSENGKEYKVFGPHDNDGLKLIKDKVTIKFITADERGFAITKKRIMDDMGFELELVSENDRFNYVLEKYGFKNLVYMGDGYHDAKIIQESKYGIAPRNARKEARDASDYITESNAGEGAVLDACLEIKRRFFSD